MNWPIESMFVKPLSEAAYTAVEKYMQAHEAEFEGSDEQTHARAQSIADALNENDIGKCIVESDKGLVENITKVLQSMRVRYEGGIPNATIVCGMDPCVVYNVSDDESTSKSKCVCWTWVPAKN